MIPFISTDDLAAYLDVTEVELGNDLIVYMALDAACQIVRDALQRGINLSEETVEVLDGSGTDALVLSQRPIQEVTEVLVRWGSDETTIDLAEDLYVENATGCIFLVDGTVFTPGKGTVTVTYAHGFALEEIQVTPDDENPADDVDRVPSSIRFVAVKLAAAIWRAKGPTSTAGLATEEHIGTYQYRVQVDQAAQFGSQYLTADDLNAIMSYRTAVLA